MPGGRISFVAVVSGIAMPCASLFAQTPTPPALPPVEVVATRIAESPRDVAASIEVISGRDLRARGVTSLREALSLATGDWYYYNLNFVSSAAPTQHWQLQPSNPGGSAGFFDIIGVPVTSDGTPAWYQLIFGDSTDYTVYNIYATSSGGFFSTVVVDHGVEVTQYSTGNFGLNFAPGPGFRSLFFSPLFSRLPQASKSARPNARTWNTTARRA